MTTLHYKRLYDGPMNEIDAALFSGDTFHDPDNIEAFRIMMARWENGLKLCENILSENLKND
jgi:hypothetical protein